MSVCKLSSEMKLNGIVPVDNLFITEFMLCAPGDFVKVYIYFLMQCYMGLEWDIPTMAHDLHMDEDKINSAIVYWSRKGLIKVSGENYIFESPKIVAACNATACNNTLSTYSDFNSALSEIMSGRALASTDLEIAYDWIDIYGMSKNCVLEMVNYAVTHKYKKGNKVSFNSLNKLAISWAEMGIMTEEKAKEYINSQLLINSDAKTILRHLGQYRNPTVDEYNMLEKWEKELGFSLEALLACCSDMLYSKSPSFALLNTLVEKYHAMGITTAKEIQKERSRDDEMFNLYKEIVQRCGGYGSATKAQRELIDGLITDGFNKQGLLYVCDYLVTADKKGLSHVVKLATELRDAGITEENEVCQELDRRNALASKVKEFIENAGFSRIPSKKDTEMYTRYSDVFSHDIMLKAATFASCAKNRSEHLLQLLEQWKNNGVKTIDEATDIAPVVKKKENDKEYIRNDRKYSDRDLFDVFE